MSGCAKLMTLIFCLTAANLALAQPAAPAPAPLPPGGGGRGAGGGGGGGVRVVGGVGARGAQNRQQTLDAIKEQLAATDEEWNALSAKIENLLDAKRGMQSGAGMSWSSINGRPAVFRVSEGNADTPVGKAMQAVRAALEDKEAAAEEITRRLSALKEAREKARTALDAAQSDLKRALTPRQEAVLQTLGVLE
jgi:Spy/CpxP family protein refolding chaperone